MAERWARLLQGEKDGGCFHITKSIVAGIASGQVSFSAKTNLSVRATSFKKKAVNYSELSRLTGILDRIGRVVDR